MLARERGARGVRHRRQGAVDLLVLDVAVDDALSEEIERVEDAAQARDRRRACR